MLTNDTVAPTETQTAPTTARAGLETKTCGRCGGGGRYSWCQRYGDVCFGCGGRGTVLTKRGRAANAYLVRLRSKLAADVAVGDVIRESGITGDGTVYDFWARVTERREDGGTLTFVSVPCKGTETLTHSGIAPDALIRVPQTVAQKRATMALAVAYQATLKPDGKPYKRPPTARTRPVLSDAEKAARKAVRVAQKAQAMQARIDAAREALSRDDVRAALAAQPHPRGFAGKTRLDWAEWMMANAGTAGRLQVVGAVERAAEGR